MTVRRVLSASLVVAASVACGGGSSTPSPAPAPTDAGTRADAAGGGNTPSEDYPPIGAGGSDTTGSCNNVPGTNPPGGDVLCVDYDMGYSNDAMAMDCATRHGTFNMDRACSTTGLTYVAGCGVTEGSLQYHLRFYRRSRGASLSRAQVTTYCSSIGGTYDGTAVPQNTGDCEADSSSLVPGNDNVRSCINFDLGWTDTTAMNNCMTGTYNTGVSCLATGAVAGCQFMRSGNTMTVWFYRKDPGGQGLTVDDVTTVCNGLSGTVVTPP